MLGTRSFNLEDTIKEGRNPDGDVNEQHRHPVAAIIGAVLAAGTAGATGGALAGPLGAVVGAIVGAVAGGLGGRAIAEVVVGASKDEQWRDSYTTRLQSHTHSIDEEESSGRPGSLDPSQAPREAWGHLDQSSKELLDDTASEDD